jgi:hypothetical protein
LTLSHQFQFKQTHKILKFHKNWPIRSINMIRATEKRETQMAGSFTMIQIKPLLLSYTVNHLESKDLYSASQVTQWCQFDPAKLMLNLILPDPQSKGLISPAIANMWWKQVFKCIIPFPYNFKQWAPSQDYTFSFFSVPYFYVCHISTWKIIILSLKTIATWFPLLQNGYKSKQLFMICKVGFGIKIIWSLHLEAWHITTRSDTQYKLQHNMLII